MPKVSTKSLRSLASKCNPSILTGAITESADYIDELETKVEQLEKEIEGLKSDKETLVNSLGIESNRANELFKEVEMWKSAVEEYR